MMSKGSSRSLNAFRLALWLAFLAFVFLTAAVRWPGADWLQTGFDSLLPGSESSPWANEATRRSSTQFGSQLLLMAEGPARRHEALLDFLDSASASLKAAGYVDENFETEQAARWRSLARSLFPYRHGLLTRADAELLAQDPALFLQQFRSKLYSPLGSSLLSGLDKDPAGLFSSFMQSSIPVPGPMAYTGKQEAYEIALLRIRDEALGFSELEGLYALCMKLKEAAKADGITLLITGAPLYSAYGVHSGRQELSTIGVASLILLSLLLALVLRSPVGLLLSLICVMTGLATALILTVAVLGQIHILTLVFGATLIGIAVDYAFHYLAHSLVPGWNRNEALGKVFRGLSLGFLSSSAAFSILMLLPFPGIRQIGLFMASGLLGAFLTVCLLFPPAYPGPSKSLRLPAFSKWPVLAVKRKGVAIAVFAALVLPGILLLEPRDDVRDFYAAPPAIGLDTETIRERMGAQQDPRFFIVTGAEPESLLQHEEALFDTARPHIDKGDLSGLTGISRLIPSARTQHSNFQQISEFTAGPDFYRHTEVLGLSEADRGAPGEPFDQEFQPVSPDILNQADLPLGVDGYLGCDQTGCASLVRVIGVSRAELLDELAASSEAVVLVDRLADINGTMADYRIALVFIMLAGAALAALLLSIVAGWRSGLSMMALPAAACLFSFAFTGYFTGTYSIINVLALFLVIGVSIDFAVFRAFTPVSEQPATSLAISLSATTSILAFGMLGFSRTPLISAFGISITAGLLFAWALSWFNLNGIKR